MCWEAGEAASSSFCLVVLEDWPVLPPGGGRFLDDLGSWKPSASAALAGLGEAERPDRGDLDLDLEW